MATDYGNRLREAREFAGLTQKQAEKKTGIAQSTISTAERLGNGSADTPLYADAYGVDALWLATGNGSMILTAPSPTVSATGGPGFSDTLAQLSQLVQSADDLTRDQLKPLFIRMLDEPGRAAEIVQRIQNVITAVKTLDSEITSADGPNLTARDRARAAQVNQAAQMAESFRPFKNAKSKT